MYRIARLAQVSNRKDGKIMDMIICETIGVISDLEYEPGKGLRARVERYEGEELCMIPITTDDPKVLNNLLGKYVEVTVLIKDNEYDSSRLYDRNRLVERLPREEKEAHEERATGDEPRS